MAASAGAFTSIFALLVVASGCIYEAEPQIPDYFTALYQLRKSDEW